MIWFKENWIRLFFSLSAGFGFAFLFGMAAYVLLYEIVGLSDDDTLAWMAIAEGTLAFGVLSSWMFKKLKN